MDLKLPSPGCKAYLSSWPQTPLVCASTPSTESSNTTAPSTTRLALSTSIPKSACPGVSMRLNVQSCHLTGMLADCIVIPLSRSAGRKSVVVLPVSTEPAEERYDDFRSMDSVRVVFPESTGDSQTNLRVKQYNTNRCGPREPCCAIWTGHFLQQWQLLDGRRLGCHSKADTT